MTEEKKPKEQPVIWFEVSQTLAEYLSEILREQGAIHNSDDSINWEKWHPACTWTSRGRGSQYRYLLQRMGSEEKQLKYRVPVRFSDRPSYEQILEEIREGFRRQSAEHARIREDIAEVHSDLKSAKDVLASFRKYPHEILTVGLSTISGLTVLAVLTGKLLGRLVIAPDFALATLVVCLTFLLMVRVDILSRRGEK